MGSRGHVGSRSRWVAAGSRWEEVSVGMLTVPCREQGELEGNRHPEAVRKKKVEEEGREKSFFFFSASVTGRARLVMHRGQQVMAYRCPPRGLSKHSDNTDPPARCNEPSAETQEKTVLVVHAE